MDTTSTNKKPAKLRAFHVHLDPHVHAQVSAKSAEDGVSMGQWVKDAIAARLEREG